MNIKNSFLVLIVSCFAAVYGYSANSFIEKPLSCQATVVDYNISEVVWTQPKDGTLPKIIKWQGTILLEDGDALTFNEKEVDPNKYYPLFLATGDLIEITNEGPHPENPKRAYYLIKIPQTDKEIEVQGPSGKLKDIYRIKKPNTFVEIDVHGSSGKVKISVMAESGEIPLEKVHLLWNQANDGKMRQEVRFFIRGTYLILPITSERYHGFYTGMPVQILDEQVVDVKNDPFNRYQKSVTFQLYETGQQFTAFSPLLSDQNPHVAEISYTDQHWVFNEYQQISVLQTWKMHITLDNGLALIVNCCDGVVPNTKQKAYRYTEGTHGRGIIPPYVEDEVHVGDEIELKEWPASSTHSYYTVRDLETGYFYDLDRPTGTVYKGHTEYCPRTIGEVRNPHNSIK